MPNSIQLAADPRRKAEGREWPQTDDQDSQSPREPDDAVPQVLVSVRIWNENKILPGSLGMDEAVTLPVNYGRLLREMMENVWTVRVQNGWGVSEGVLDDIDT